MQTADKWIIGVLVVGLCGVLALAISEDNRKANRCEATFLIAKTAQDSLLVIRANSDCKLR